MLRSVRDLAAYRCPLAKELSRRAANVEIDCPVQPGVHTVTHTVSLPSEIPPGELVCVTINISLITYNLAKFNVALRGYTLEDDDMTCLNLWIDLLIGLIPDLISISNRREYIYK